MSTGAPSSAAAFQGRNPRKESPLPWVVSESVERAISVLERLQPDDAKYLFTALSANEWARGGNRFAPASVTIKCTNRNLNQFVDWDQHLLRRTQSGRRHSPARPADQRLAAQQRPVPAGPWHGSSLGRPGGAIGRHNIQYPPPQHPDVREGYAGTSDSGFRGEGRSRTKQTPSKEARRLLAMIENHQHQDLRGPAAGEAQTRLDNLQRSPRVHRQRGHRPATTPEDHAPRRTRTSTSVTFVTCIYNPEKALLFVASSPPTGIRRRLTLAHLANPWTGRKRPP